MNPGAGEYLVNKGVEGSGLATILGEPSRKGIEAAAKREAMKTPKPQKVDPLKGLPQGYFADTQGWLTQRMNDRQDRYADEVSWYHSQGQQVPFEVTNKYQKENNEDIAWGKTDQQYREAYEALSAKMTSGAEKQMWYNDHNIAELNRYENPAKYDPEGFKEAGGNMVVYRGKYPLNPIDNKYYPGINELIKKKGISTPATGKKVEIYDPIKNMYVSTDIDANTKPGRVATLYSAYWGDDDYKGSASHYYAATNQKERDKYSTYDSFVKTIPESTKEERDEKAQILKVITPDNYSPEAAWMSMNYEKDLYKQDTGYGEQMGPQGDGDKITYDLGSTNKQDQNINYTSSIPGVGTGTLTGSGRALDINKEMDFVPSLLYDVNTGKEVKLPTDARGVTLVRVMYASDWTDNVTKQTTNKPTLMATVSYKNPLTGTTKTYVTPYKNVENFIKKTTKVSQDGQVLNRPFDPYKDWGASPSEDYNRNTSDEIRNAFGGSKTNTGGAKTPAPKSKKTVRSYKVSKDGKWKNVTYTDGTTEVVPNN